ncbi:MAG TPA: hypothetical protein VHE10_03880 [Candidatus Paceibacterota bacterium]|nr:hypothetical protein [Candidatus Paceibacterota bacterium]
MPETKTASPSAREARIDQKRFQQRKARIASIWTGWLAFEKPLREKEPVYLKFLYDTVRRIAQEKDFAKNRDRQNIAWDEARNRVFTHEFLESAAARFDKAHKDIMSDVSKVASHNSWIAGLNDRGEYRILSEVTQEMRGIEGGPSKPVFADPAPLPVLSTATEVNRMLMQAREDDVRIEREFMGDTPPAPRTGAFSFLTDVDRQARYIDRSGKPRKKGRNWRKEC